MYLRLEVRPTAFWGFSDSRKRTARASSCFSQPLRAKACKFSPPPIPTFGRSGRRRAAGGAGRRSELQVCGEVGPLRGCAQCYVPFPHSVRNVFFAYPFVRAIWPLCDRCIFAFLASLSRYNLSISTARGSPVPTRPSGDITSAFAASKGNRFLLRKLGVLARARARDRRHKRHPLGSALLGTLPCGTTARPFIFNRRGGRADRRRDVLT